MHGYAKAILKNLLLMMLNLQHKMDKCAKAATALTLKHVELQDP